MLYVTHSCITFFFVIVLIYLIKAIIYIHVWVVFHIFSKCHHQLPAMCIQRVYTHTLAFPVSISISMDLPIRWKRSPWCLHWSHPEVTDSDQNSFYWEAERGSVSRLPCCMGSITQDDSISLNNAVAPCPGLGCDVHHCVHTDMKERGQRFLWMIKAQLE